MKSMIAAATVAALLSATGVAQAATPLWGSALTASEVLSASETASFQGPPDDLYTGLGAGFITYDFGDFRIEDGAGQDLNVYEFDGGIVEFGSLDVLVSADGTNFFSITASSAAAVDIVGDEAHGAANFRRSFDVGAAVTGLGVSQFRYLRLDGTTAAGAIQSTNGFDLDAVAVINYGSESVGAVPEPGAWALMILGFGAAGSMIRRRRNVLAI